MRSAISRAIESLRHDFGANAFIADEANRSVKINLPFFIGGLTDIQPGTSSEAIKKRLRECIRKNNNIAKMKSNRDQKKLF